jgi:hypothetical protein
MVDAAIRFNISTTVFWDPNDSWATGSYDPAVLIKDNGLDYNGEGFWTVESQDPVRFGVVPEPASITMLLLAVGGLAAARISQKRT